MTTTYTDDEELRYQEARRAEEVHLEQIERDRMDRDRMYGEERIAEREQERLEMQRELDREELARRTELEETEFRERLALLDREIRDTEGREQDARTYEDMRRTVAQGFSAYAARERTVLPPLESLVKKVPGSEKLPSFGSLIRELKTREETEAAALAVKQATTEATIAENKKKKKIRKIQPKRIRQAETIDYFKTHSTGRPMFYRYIRLPDENTRMGKTVFPSPFGGACVLIVLSASNSIKFTFSLCQDDEIFIKDEARRLCQIRYKHGVLLTVRDMNAEASMFDNIVLAYENAFFNQNKEPSEPKLVAEPGVTHTSLKKLYKMMKYYVKTGGIIA